MAAADIGQNSSLAVFITYPDGEYDVGDDVIITVHVFRGGEYYDPDSVSLTVGAEDREIGLTPQETGKFKGVVTIQDDDLSSLGTMRTKAEATYFVQIFSWSANDHINIPTLVWRSFDVDVLVPDAMDLFPQPGQEVEFVVDLRYRGSPVDPDADTLMVQSIDPSDNTGPITVSRVATGRFQGTFTVPEGLKESSIYTIDAEAEYTRDFTTFDDEDDVDVSVDFFDVWAHILDVTTSEADVEFMVLDGDGNPVSGATVEVEHSYFDEDWNNLGDSQSEDTDGDGFATFTFEYPVIGPQWWRVDVEGRVSSGGLTQIFDGDLFGRDRIEWTGDGGDSGFVVSILSDGPFELGDSVTLEHQASEDGTPLDAIDVDYYLANPHQVFAYGTETTDGDGKFSFLVKMPEADPDRGYNDMGAYYQGDTDDGIPKDYQYIKVGHKPLATLMDDLVDDDATISVQPFSVGETVAVSFDHPDADGEDENAFLMWGIGSPPDWEVDGNLEWESWNFGGVNEMRMVPAEWVDGQYVATFASPVFLTESSEMFLYGTITFIDEGDLEEAGVAARITSISPEPPNPAPIAAITTPQADEKHGGTLRIQGTASDDASLEKVEVRIDGGAWMTADGTTSWSYQVDTTKISEANHTVEVRSFDGQKYSEIQSVTFAVDQSVVKNDKDKDSAETPGFGASILVLAMLTAILVAVGKRRR
jgi:hypothetical protein